MGKYLDRWSLVHFAAFFALAPGLKLLHVGDPERWFVIPALIVLWELIEAYLERVGVIGSVENWRDRWLSDPIVGMAGALAGAHLVS